MVMTSSEHSSSSVSGPTKRVANGLYVSVIALMALCSKQASRVSRKLKTKPNSSKVAPRSPLTRPKQLFTNISNKAIMFVSRKKMGGENEVGSEEFGDGGVWQRSILMGDKCQPLDFSGVIYYDENGHQLEELPMRSPRASPLPGYLAKRGM